MENSSRVLLSAIALAMLAACGGGGVEGPTGAEAAAAAAAPSTSRQVAPARDSSVSDVLSAPSAAQAMGSGSGADIGPGVDPLVANRVSAELDQLEQILRRVDNGKIEKHEALEVVSDARMELDKERPNKLKLRSLLAGLAQGAQALDGVKGAGKFLGQLVPMI